MEMKKGRPMTYSSFIIGLSNERLYGIDTVLEEAQSKRLFQTKLFEGMAPLVARKRAYDVLTQYRRRKLPKKPDGPAMPHIPRKRFQGPEHKSRQKHPAALGRRLLRGLRIIMGVSFVWRSL